MPQDIQSRLTETWQLELWDLGQRPNDFLPKHQQMQIKSEPLQSLQDKKEQCQKDVGKWAGDTERTRNEIEEKDAQLQELGRKNPENILGRSGIG